MVTILVASLCSFLLGSVPFGVLVARTKGVNILEVGSGNIGATNVWRALGPGPGSVVFILDFAKGLAPALYGLIALQAPHLGLLLGIVAVIGHSFSPWIGFKGGKGVATGFGAILGAVPIVAAITLGTFLIVLGTTRYVSLASILASGAMITSAWLSPLPMEAQIALSLLGAWVIFRHRANIGRLMNGTENKFGRKKENAG